MEETRVDMEEFKALAKEMKPVIKNMEDILKKHGVECLASLAISTDGYFRFNIHDSDWTFQRADSSDKSVISMCMREEV